MKWNAFCFLPAFHHRFTFHHLPAGIGNRKIIAVRGKFGRYHGPAHVALRRVFQIQTVYQSPRTSFSVCGNRRVCQHRGGETGVGKYCSREQIFCQIRLARQGTTAERDRFSLYGHSKAERACLAEVFGDPYSRDIITGITAPVKGHSLQRSKLVCICQNLVIGYVIGKSLVRQLLRIIAFPVAAFILPILHSDRKKRIDGCMNHIFDRCHHLYLLQNSDRAYFLSL